MRISLIVAASENNVIGRNNDLPWNLPDDLKNFRSITKGHPVVMGRKTFESIGHPLPNRKNIVVSRTWNVGEHDGYTVVASLGDAFVNFMGTDEEVFVIGGEAMFKKSIDGFLPSEGEVLIKHMVADRIYLTRVHAEIEGDVFFPELPEDEWEEVEREEHTADDRHEYAFTFLTLDRRK